jgi:hypothetical protein
MLNAKQSTHHFAREDLTLRFKHNYSLLSYTDSCLLSAPFSASSDVQAVPALRTKDLVPMAMHPKGGRIAENQKE